jgi:hypothetical protein
LIRSTQKKRQAWTEPDWAWRWEIQIKHVSIQYVHTTICTLLTKQVQCTMAGPKSI